MTDRFQRHGHYLRSAETAEFERLFYIERVPAAQYVDQMRLAREKQDQYRRWLANGFGL